MHKPVALILLNWNTPQHTSSCIASLKRYCNEALFDIVIVDNGSTDGSLSYLQSIYPNLVYIDNKANLGFAEGNNAGLRYSIQQGYNNTLLLNTDTLVDEDVVFKLSKHLNNHPKAAAVQPIIYWMNKRDQVWNGEGKFNNLLGLTVSDTSIPTSDIKDNYLSAKWVTGCCVLLRNSALVHSGLLNKRFFLYYEDVDLSYRLRESGYELHYLPGCKVYHEAGVSAKKNNAKVEGHLSPVIHYYISRNHLWFIRRYGNSILYPLHLIYNGLYYLSAWVYFRVRGRKQKAAYVIKGLKDGLTVSKASIWALENLQ